MISTLATDRPEEVQMDYEDEYAYALMGLSLTNIEYIYVVHTVETDLPNPLASFLVDRQNDRLLNFLQYDNF